jgi:hypothetical protein
MGTKEVAVKFCKNMAGPSKQKECIEAMEEIFSSSEKGDIQMSLDRLSKITGKDPASISDYLSKNCPLCDTGQPHEH